MAMEGPGVMQARVAAAPVPAAANNPAQDLPDAQDLAAFIDVVSSSARSVIDRSDAFANSQSDEQLSKLKIGGVLLAAGLGQPLLPPGFSWICFAFIVLALLFVISAVSKLVKTRGPPGAVRIANEFIADGFTSIEDVEPADAKLYQMSKNELRRQQTKLLLMLEGDRNFYYVQARG